MDTSVYSVIDKMFNKPSPAPKTQKVGHLNFELKRFEKLFSLSIFDNGMHLFVKPFKSLFDMRCGTI